jgi:putative tryptophan/tyrosine transport system substrate-binding protein
LRTLFTTLRDDMACATVNKAGQSPVLPVVGSIRGDAAWKGRVMNGRREFLATLALGPGMAQSAIAAQTRLLGALDPFADSDSSEALLRKSLQDFGYAEAKSQRIVMLRTNGQDGLLPKLATDLVALRPHVILTWGDDAARAVQAATTSIPIVVMTDNLVAAGHVANMNRPGGNLTGVSVMATELDVKRLELLAQMLKPRSHVMLLADAVTPPLSRSGLRRAATALGLELTEAIVRTPQDMQDAIAGARKRNVSGINVLASRVLWDQSEHLIRWIKSAGLPAIFEWGFLADEGALIGYGPLLKPLYFRLLNQVVQLMNGGKVADFPVEQPTVFELVINLVTAKAIGVDVPRTLLLRADRVIT